MGRYFLLAALSIFSASVFGQKSPEDRWAQERYDAMTFDDRIGQLFMIRAHSNLGEDHIASVENTIKTYHIGGLCFFQGTPEKQAELTNRYQAISPVPLFIAMDAEWGASMRMKEAAIAYPKQLTLGAIQDNRLIYDFGSQVAKELKRMGVNINFAPDADVNTNPQNPVINDRSFGEEPRSVLAKAFMYMQGMQDNGVLACAKHFPGHGDAAVDSHVDLPLIAQSMARLQSVELAPFRGLSQHGIASIMVAHLQVPAIDSAANTPSSLSKKTITGLLRDKIGYDGLIFTDALEMKGITKYYSKGDVSAKCLEAGNDMLLLPESVPDAIESIKRYISEGKIDTQQINASVLRILHAKYRAGLNAPQTIQVVNLRSDLNSQQGIALKTKLVRNALTLVRDANQFIPLSRTDPGQVAVLSIGGKQANVFQQTLSDYGLVRQFNLPKGIEPEAAKKILDSLKGFRSVIISLHGLDSKASADYGTTESMKRLIGDVARQNNTALVVFGNPYALKYFDNVPVVVEAYDEDPITQAAAAQGIMGAIPFMGKLPVSASALSKSGTGLTTTVVDKLLFNVLPEAAGLDGKKMLKIDSIAAALIAAGAAPGCQILVAKDNQVVYNKCFGYLTYDKTQPVEKTTLYDMASITKVAATTITLMKLFDEKKIDVYAPLSNYIPYLKGTNKENMLIRDILIHQAGLKAWIPFYKETLDSTQEKKFFPSAKFYASAPHRNFDVPVGKNLFMRADYKDSIKMIIASSPLRPNTDYVYSDMGMILMADAIKNITGKTLDVYAKDTFYARLGMNHTMFNPLNQFPADQIAPTEEDAYFRNQRLQGYVHDMGAAMLGGVSGHAGLFSTASDLAILMQTLLNKGVYGGRRYFSQEAVRFFTSRQGGSTRRGLGWDMKEIGDGKAANMSSKASPSTFGHSGFTGNVAWADPENGLIFIFISNRTYPTMDNNKITEGNYRPQIQSAIYEAFIK